MKNFKRMLSLLLALMMIFSLSACGTDTTAPSASQTQEPSESSATDSSSSEPVEFSIMITAPAEFTTEDNAWIEELNEKANANITWIAFPQSNFWEKRNTTMAGQDYPDVIMIDTSGKNITDNLYESMVKNEIILPLDDYLTPEIAPNILEYTNEASWKGVADPSGSQYVIPRSTIIREDFMTIRTDWMQALEIETPVTIDDWKAYFNAVANEDPDGNGVKDTYGTTEQSEMMNPTSTINMEFFARVWNADKNWYLDENGEVFYGVFAKDGRFKNVLQFYQDLNNDGSLDPDFISNKGPQSQQERLEQGAVSSIRLFAGNLDRHLNTLRAITPEANLELVDFPVSAEADVYESEQLISTNAGLYEGWALTTTAKGKEAEIIRVLDYLLSDEGWNLVRNGVEGVHYEMNGEEKTNLEPEYGLFAKWAGYVQLLRRPNDENLWLKNILPDTYDHQKEWLNYSIDYMNNYDQTSLIGMQSEAETEFYKSDLFTTEFPALCVEIIYGEKSVDEWDAFIERVYAEGWQDVTDEYNEFYNSNN